ncbi:helix-turn-helix transcriptional regulator [Streptomyces sp. NBC_01022]|uniref:helix-turn-helix transcriptional regulator n=1 Tax=Streptomyces sp. NBC_01022 TaxID=2903723 RepID=UPI002DDA97AB|nr:helix-turn-helix transcriptional regulator [Streptomyces sp. NBC_01022]WRZ82906.1 helix-turn-helix transcriptional regulator [Streptomyces sp. NBC_01022]
MNEPTERVRQRFYGLIHRNPGWSLEQMAAEAQCSLAEADRACDQLCAAGLLVPASSAPCGYVTVTPKAALTRLFSAEERHTTAHLQHLARIRGAVASLIGDYPRLHDERRESVEIETLPTPALVNAFLEDAGSTCNVRMRSMHPGGPPPEELMDDMLLRDKEMEGRGIRVETLYSRRTAEVPYMAAYLTDAERIGRTARTADYLPLRMILFDDDLAVLPINPQDSSEGASAIHGQALVRSLHALYDYCWHTSAPVRPAAPGSTLGTELDSHDLVVVRMLADGVKDETIARHLGISPRTLSRYMTCLMDRLGVHTRFQAALRVAELQLLD